MNQAWPSLHGGSLEITLTVPKRRDVENLIPNSNSVITKCLAEPTFDEQMALKHSRSHNSEG